MSLSGKQVEFEAHPDRVNLFVEKGEALVKALEEARRLAPSDVQSHATKNLKRGDSKVDAEAIAASLSPEEQAAHRAAAERRDSLTEFLASPLSIPTRKSPSRIRKKWLEAVPKRHIDYSAYFTSNIGLKEGLVVFRIDDLKPVLVPAAKQHTLCLGDCYIVLNTFESEQGNGRLEWSIYQWIGDRAALDKKACSAIFAVGLRNHLGASSEVRRELAHEESTAFLELFATLDTELSYVEAAKATPSGLFKVQAVEYPLRIYRVQAAAIERQGKVIRKLGDDFALALMEPVVESLSSHYSYLIDNGLRIYTWNGKDAPLSDRSKCRLLGEKICKSERPAGKARLDVVEEGEELPDFWETFDGERRSTVVKADAEQTKATIPSPKLYVYVGGQEVAFCIF